MDDQLTGRLVGQEQIMTGFLISRFLERVHRDGVFSFQKLYIIFSEAVSAPNVQPLCDDELQVCWFADRWAVK